jgi:hypothetical protein
MNGQSQSRIELQNMLRDMKPFRSPRGQYYIHVSMPGQSGPFEEVDVPLDSSIAHQVIRAELIQFTASVVPTDREVDGCIEILRAMALNNPSHPPSDDARGLRAASVGFDLLPAIADIGIHASTASLYTQFLRLALDLGRQRELRREFPNEAAFVQKLRDWREPALKIGVKIEADVENDSSVWDIYRTERPTDHETNGGNSDV